MNPKTLDHVAYWVADRDPIVEFATEHLGMHVIDNQENFTLIGSDARRERRIVNLAIATSYYINENKMSDGWRERASLRVEGGISWKITNRSCQPFAPSLG